MTILRCNIQTLVPLDSGATFQEACGHDRASGEEADEAVEAWNDGPLFTRIRARLRETYGRNESARSGLFVGAIVPYGHKRGWTCQDACKLPNDDGYRTKQVLILLIDGRCCCKMARVRRARACCICCLLRIVTKVVQLTDFTL